MRHDLVTHFVQEQPLECDDICPEDKLQIFFTDDEESFIQQKPRLCPAFCP